jgi:tetratricopeptide (TPR) repeat protein
LQGELARAIAGQISIHLTPHEQARLTSRPISPEAHDSYLKGRFHWHTRRTGWLPKSIEYFNQAIEKEPRFAFAYVGLADSYSVLARRSAGPQRKELEAQACEAARKAIELDDNLGEAHASLARCENDWDWQKRERQFRRALELSPGYAAAHQWYGGLLIKTGRFDEGLSECRRAAELDPHSLTVNATLGWAFHEARQYDSAIRQLRLTIDERPNFVQPLVYLGMVYLAKAMYTDAINVLENTVKLAGDAPVLLPQARVLLAHARARTGDNKEAQRLLDEFSKRKGIYPLVFSLLYMDVGDKDRAFEWLAKGVEERFGHVDELKVEPLYDSLRSDPRFTALLRKMNLAN